jgi:hypothetical protein
MRQTTLLLSPQEELCLHIQTTTIRDLLTQMMMMSPTPDPILVDQAATHAEDVDAEAVLQEEETEVDLAMDMDTDTTAEMKLRKMTLTTSPELSGT